MNNETGSALYIVLGAILALCTSLVVEFLKEISRQKNLRNNFKTVLNLDFKNITQIVDKLNEDYGSKTFFPISVLDQLDRSLKRIEDYRKDAIYLKENEKKEEILTCLNDILVLAADMRSNETYAFTKREEESEDDKKNRLSFCERQRQMYSLRSVDIKRRIQDIMTFLGK